MKHLIDKDIIVAEIERRCNQEVQWMEKQGYTEYHQGLRDGYVKILSHIDTLEVKEVELDDKGEWRNTGGLGSTWDPDSPDYCPD